MAEEKLCYAQFVEQKHYKFAEEAKDWKDAIRHELREP